MATGQSEKSLQFYPALGQGRAGTRGIQRKLDAGIGGSGREKGGQTGRMYEEESTIKMFL